MAPPRYSIVIPMYNAASGLPRMLRSISAQSFSDYEVLLLDDGSEDDTLNVARALVGADPRFRLIARPHVGAAGAVRNAGLALATGEYLLFWDADDEVTPDALAIIDAAVQRFGAADLFAFQGEEGELNPAGVFVPSGRFGNFTAADGEGCGQAMLERLFLRHRNLGSYGVINLYRRAFLLAHDLRQPEEFVLREDHQWMARVFFFARRVVAVDGCLYHYIRHGGSLTTRLSRRSLEDVIACLLSLAQFFREHREAMRPQVRRFWAAHALDGLFWYFYNPFYADRFDPAERREVLRRLDAPEARRLLWPLFPELSRPKQVGWILIAGRRLWGDWAPRLFFGRLFYRRRPPSR